MDVLPLRDLSFPGFSMSRSHFLHLLPPRLPSQDHTLLASFRRGESEKSQKIRYSCFQEQFGRRDTERLLEDENATEIRFSSISTIYQSKPGSNADVEK